MKAFDGRLTLYAGDCREVLRTLPDNAVDSVVTDPPYHLTSIVARFGKDGSAPAQFGSDGRFARASAGFMGQQWDGGDIAFRPELWAEVLRVLKPGGYCVAFSGTRTYHRMACAIEDAGFEIRDMVSWLYGSGFPKSHNIGDGWGTALKPALEPICLARKPLSEGTVAANVLKHGTGAIHVDACRVAIDPNVDDARLGGRGDWSSDKMAKNVYEGGYAGVRVGSSPLGRWPANVVHDGSDEVVAAFPETGAGAFPAARGAGGIGNDGHRGQVGLVARETDSGSAARFFYCAKANKADRAGSRHPTVKPVDLMRWLVRLVTPPGGVTLDPFAGTGTTGEAAIREGFRAILIEREAAYCDDIARRVALMLEPPRVRKTESLKARAKTQGPGPLFEELEP